MSRAAVSSLPSANVKDSLLSAFERDLQTANETHRGPCASISRQGLAFEICMNAEAWVALSGCRSQKVSGFRYF